MFIHQTSVMLCLFSAHPHRDSGHSWRCRAALQGALWNFLCGCVIPCAHTQAFPPDRHAALVNVQPGRKGRQDSWPQCGPLERRGVPSLFERVSQLGQLCKPAFLHFLVRCTESIFLGEEGHSLFCSCVSLRPWVPLAVREVAISAVSHSVTGGKQLSSGPGNAEL